MPSTTPSGRTGMCLSVISSNCWRPCNQQAMQAISWRTRSSEWHADKTCGTLQSRGFAVLAWGLQAAAQHEAVSPCMVQAGLQANS